MKLIRIWMVILALFFFMQYITGILLYNIYLAFFSIIGLMMLLLMFVLIETQDRGGTK